MATSSFPLDKDVPGAGSPGGMAVSRQAARTRLALAMAAPLVVIVDHAAPGPQDHALLLAFLPFAIALASLRHGAAEGLRLSIIAVALYCAASPTLHAGMPPAWLLLRAAMLLAFGAAIAQVGGHCQQAMRREALLRELGRMANPRFGVDRTMTAALERIRAFFKAGSCVVLLEDSDSGRHAMRAVRSTGPQGPQAAAPTPVGAGLARMLLPEPRSHLLLYVRPWRHAGTAGARSLSHAGGSGQWMAHDQRCLRKLADLLEAGSFISAPLVFARGRGRIYVSARGRHLRRGDARFLARIAQELRTIDRIDLLDRLASESAARERKKIALDLHDTAIQSCIGLQLGLTALCRRAAPSNPLGADLGRLAAMAADVAVQLREYARRSAGEPVAEPVGNETVCLAALRRLAGQARAAYGVEVSIEVDGAPAFGDRLAAEVLQIVREGISNICRHTTARRGAVLLHCGAELLRIDISNRHGAGPPPPFRPRSISERAATLGGTAFVREGRFHETIVCVEIPL